jgi:hypothetical protein
MSTLHSLLHTDETVDLVFWFLPNLKSDDEIEGEH